MWVPKWYWKAFARQLTELERRVKRLELMFLEDAQNKIANLRNAKAGSVSREGVSTIEEVANKGFDA